MKIIPIFVCIFVVSQAAQLRSITSFPVSKPNNLGFGNYTDVGVPPSFVADAVNIINGASGFYKNDVEANIKYIKTNLDRLYGDGITNFNVYIQTQADVNYSWYVYCFYAFKASLQNVNIINRGWSYFIVRLYGPKDLSVYTYLKIPEIGPGISQNIRVFISNTISLYEPYQQACSCNTQSLIDIGNALIQKYDQPWNTICDASGVTQGIVNAVDGLWGTFRAKRCYYTLFVHSTAIGGK